MSQTKQLQKAKLYRALKIVFYTLGLPLFFFAVFCTAIKFIGEDPFVGMADSSLSTGVFQGYETFITSPALSGIWCALAVWVFIVICHAVLSKTAKNFKVRLFTMLAIILVVMLGTMGIMDAVFESRINKMIDDAPAGVTIQDYKSQLSYYDWVSFNRKDKSLINQLMDKVDRLKDVYNIKYQGIDKSGDAGNISNKPVTYANIIADDGTVGAGDLSDKLIEVAPNGNGELVIDGKVYSHYYYVSRKGANGVQVYVWYNKDLVPVGYEWKGSKGKMTFNTTDGIYGEGLYNQNGMLSDGWIFSFENVLEILEDVYEGEEYLAGADDAKVTALKTAAAKLRDEYYTGVTELSTGAVDPIAKALYGSEQINAENFSMPRARLEKVVSYLGAMLGNNNLFDWLFYGGGESVLTLVNGSLTIDNLKNGVSLGTLLGEDTMGTVLPLVNQALGRDDITDLYLVLEYQTEAHKNLYLALCNALPGETKGADKSPAGTLLDIDFAGGLLEGGEEGEYKLDLDRLSTFLNTAVGNLLEANPSIGSLIETLGGLIFKDMQFKGVAYKGLEISGIQIPLFEVETIDEKTTRLKFNIDVNGILVGLLEGFYTYQSPVIKPVWDFYYEAALKDETLSEKDKAAYLELAQYLANYERAYYEATVYGGMIGSTLIGDTLGAGNYPAALGLTDLASVRQLKSDLSYQPELFPLFNFRDMLLTSSGIVILFYLLYMIAAEKEKQYSRAVCESCGEAGGEGEEEGKKHNAFVASVMGATHKVKEGVDKVGASASKAVENLKQRMGWDDNKTVLATRIITIILYVAAFLPLVIIPIVLAAKGHQLLPAYSGWHFLAFIIMLVFALIFTLVVVLVSRKKSKKSIASQGMRIVITYICLTTVFGLLLTYVLPDPVAKATSSTLYTEDMYYNGEAQIHENAALERQFIMYNLLNGNLNRYDAEGNPAENGDFSYAGITAHTKNNGVFVYSNEEIKNAVAEYKKQFKYDKVNAQPALSAIKEYVAGLPEYKAELYDFVFNSYVLADYDYAFAALKSNLFDRRVIALATVDYLYAHAGYEKLIKDGFKNAKLKQLFDDNYDSFNQDGYKTFDDSLLLYAQLDGRMTVPVIIRLILNKGWTYTQTAEVDGKTVIDENNSFLYEIYDPATYDKFVEEEHGTFDHDGTLMNADGSSYSVKYGVNSEGWMVYANKRVRRPLNWLVLDMLGDPMDLTSIDLSNLKVADFSFDTLMPALESFDTFEALDGLLNEDVLGLINTLTDGAGLRVGVYLDDDKQLHLQLLPMNSTYGMLGYMQASWVQSDNLLMAIINIANLRNYVYIFGGLGIVLIVLATLLREVGKRASDRLLAAPAECEAPTDGGEAPTDGGEAPVEEAEVSDETPATEAVE